MRNYTRALAAAAVAVPLAFAVPAVASADTTGQCLSQADHDTWVSKVGWYTTGKATHEKNLADAKAVVAQRQQDVAEAQAVADGLAEQVRKASADKNAALSDIEYRKGLIAAMQAKLPTYVAKVESAKDEIEKQQGLYRKAKDAGDAAAMDAAHAAADAAREARDAAQAQVEHYTNGQVSAQQHIDKSQAIVDQATALGKTLYPQYLKAQEAVKTAQAAVESAKAPLAGLEGKVADITKYLATAQGNAALPVCEAEETTPPATGGDDTGGGDQGGTDQGGEPGTDGEQPAEQPAQPVEQPAATATSVVTVPQSVATQPAAAAQPAAVTTAAAPAGQGSSTPLAYTGAGDIATPIAAGLLMMVGGATLATWTARRQH